MNPTFDRQFQEIAEKKVGEVRQAPLPSGGILITVDNVQLPSGWNRDATSVRFVAPNGYPFAQPDCFWADEGLALENGLVPQASNNQPIPEINAPGTWFSWHVQQWNPSKDSLLAYFQVIKQRLQKAQ